MKELYKEEWFRNLDKETQAMVIEETKLYRKSLSISRTMAAIFCNMVGIDKLDKPELAASNYMKFNYNNALKLLKVRNADNITN